MLAATLASGAPSAPQPPKDEATQKRIAQLIEQLGDKDYYVRQRAQADLLKIGFAAHDALSEAAGNDDLEIAARAKYLLRQIRIEWTLSDDSEEVKEILKDYEFQPPEERRNRIASLAELPDGAGIGALCRLVRFEQSEEMSKWSAIAIMAQDEFDEELKPAWYETIRKMLTGCRRSGARWLFAFVDLRRKPPAGIDPWTQLAAAEQALLRRDSKSTSAALLSSLWRIQVSALEQLNRIDAAAEVLQRLLATASERTSALAELIEWAIDKKAWRVVDDVAQRHPTEIAGHCALLYLMAEACAARGDTQGAAENVKKARGQYTADMNGLRLHLAAAYRMFHRGRYDWAEQEFRDVIEKGTKPPAAKKEAGAAPPKKAAAQPGSSVGQQHAISAYVGLAEMLHDQAQSLRAGETLKELDESLFRAKANDAEVGREGYERKVGEIRARMHYFYSYHYREKGQLDLQRKHLDLALEADPAEIDVLIACYRLKQATPEYRRKILDLIRKMIDDTLEQIAAEPAIPTPYNNIAWLVGNTEGDFDKAIKWSRMSISLTSDRGGYYDTLARVYYAKGDLPSAVKYQSKAVKLEPHYGLVGRQLQFFKSELAKRDKSAPAAPKP